MCNNDHLLRNVAFAFATVARDVALRLKMAQRNTQYPVLVLHGHTQHIGRAKE
jgi:hypothetical protein